jgi:hypothetical protein
MKLSTEEFKGVLEESLGDIAVVKNETIQLILTKYAIRLANLSNSDDPEGERDDIVTNARIELAAEGVYVEQVVGRVIKTLASVALKLALA